MTRHHSQVCYDATDDVLAFRTAILITVQSFFLYIYKLLSVGCADNLAESNTRYHVFTVCVDRFSDNCARAFAFEERSVVISHLPVTNCEALEDINNKSNTAPIY